MFILFNKYIRVYIYIPLFRSYDNISSYEKFRKCDKDYKLLMGIKR